MTNFSSLCLYTVLISLKGGSRGIDTDTRSEEDEKTDIKKTFACFFDFGYADHVSFRYRSECVDSKSGGTEN